MPHFAPLWDYGKKNTPVLGKMFMKNNEVIKHLHTNKQNGLPIIVAGVGSGLTARGAVAGGADIIAVYNTAVYRIRGIPTALAFLPYDDANALTLSVAPEVISAASNVPVLVGFGAHDPRVPLDNLLDQAQALGAAGVTNEPFSGIYSKDLRMQLEASGLGFTREVELIRRAVERGMLTLGWVFNPEEARRMTKTGTQLLGTMIGVTSGGVAGGAAITSIDEAIECVVSMANAAHEVREDIIVLGHGGPFNDPSSVSLMLARTPLDGYVTGSTGERIPVEKSVAQAIREFKQAHLGGGT